MSRIAILMSTYNGEQFLEKQLNSIANQKCEAEICLYIRDDGSSDLTEQIISSWKERISLHYAQGKNIGPAKSFWNLLMDKSIDADYYAFCDQDDIWDENKLQIAIEHLTGNTHLYACNCRSIDSEDKIIDKVRKEKAPNIKLENLFVSGFTQGCAMVFTKSFRKYIEELNIKYVTMHDVILCMYALSYGEVYWDQEPHFSYRFHENNVVANKRHSGIVAKAQTMKRWKKTSNVSLTKVAEELESTVTTLSEDEKAFITNMVNAKRSLRSKIFLISYKGIKNMDSNSLKSFYMRIALNLI